MAEIRIDEELLLRAGLGIGYAFAPFFRGLLQGVEDYEVESAQRVKSWRKTTRSKKCGKRNIGRKPKFPIAGSAGAINARGWRNAHNPAKAQSRTGYARSPVSVAGTVCASSLAKKRNAKTSCRA